MAAKKKTTPKGDDMSSSEMNETMIRALIRHPDVKKILATAAAHEAARIVAASKSGGSLSDESIILGMIVAARVGTSFVPARVIDIYVSTKRPEKKRYDLVRLDDGKKGLGLKAANELYPAERAKPPTNDA